MLPKLPNNLRHIRSETIGMGQINYTDYYKQGDFSESYGISASRFPNIHTRWKRQQIVEPSDTTAIYSWDGYEIRVTGGVLYLDDKPLDNVSQGPKQFAVVNTKLIIWPDKAFIDFSGEEPTFGKLDSPVKLTNVSFTPTSISSVIYPVTESDVMPAVWRGSVLDWQPGVYSYGKNPEAIKWTSENGWNLPEGQLRGIWASKSAPYPALEVGDIIIPAKSRNAYTWVFADLQAGELPDISKQNQLGYYGVISKFEGEISTDNSRWLVYFDVFNVASNVPLFSKKFAIGDPVKISGTVGGYNDADRLFISKITDDPNSIDFGEAVFSVPDNYVELTQTYGKNTYSIKNDSVGDGSYYYFNAVATLEKGHFVFQEGTNIIIWDPINKEEVTRYKGYYSVSSSGIDLGGFKYSGSNTSVVVKRDVPDFDFICSSKNRLWGCSSKEHSINASALGEPQNFYKFDGTDDDSWFAAIGSENSFTGCIPFGDSVLFFKEAMLHRVSGDYPSSYYCTDRPADGVQNGSYKSLQIVQGILYYLGVRGVYAYMRGGRPQRVSLNLGEAPFKNGVAGTDGDSYYLSAERDGKKNLFVYSPIKNIWTRESSEKALEFSRTGAKLHMLFEDGSVKVLNSLEDDPDVEWEAVLKPIYESVFGRKVYNKLLIRLEAPAGSFVNVFVRKDGGAWEHAESFIGADNDTSPIRIIIGRCDRLEIKLSGHGPCTILNLARQFRIGSDK